MYKTSNHKGGHRLLEILFLPIFSSAAIGIETDDYVTHQSVFKFPVKISGGSSASRFMQRSRFRTTGHLVGRCGEWDDKPSELKGKVES